jgi:hypothetical protein
LALRDYVAFEAQCVGKNCADRHVATSASVTKTQVNPAFGVGLLYTPGGPFTFGVQTIFDFQQPINFTVQSMPFPSAFYTVHAGNQLNTTVVVTASTPITFATHFGLGF